MHKLSRSFGFRVAMLALGGTAVQAHAQTVLASNDPAPTLITNSTIASTSDSDDAAQQAGAPQDAGPRPLNAPRSALPSTLAFQPLPYDEAYTQFADPTLRTTTWSKLKHIPLWQDGYLTIGGDIRLRTEDREHLNFGRGVEDHGLDLQHRLRLWGDLHINPYVRVFTELQATDTHGYEAPTNGVDTNQGELHQAFVEAKAPIDAQGGNAFLRVGRQEIAFGKARLFDTRNGPNTRRSFDAIRAQAETNGWRFGALGGWVMSDTVGAFNDGTNYNFSFMAGHVSRKFGKTKNTELELLYIHSNRRAAPAPVFLAERDTLSARLAGRVPNFEYDVELIGQHGETRLTGQPIRAWFVGVDAGYQLPGAWKPRIGTRIDIGSGDRNPNDRTSGTYDFLWSRGQTFTAEFGYSNLIQAGPSFGIHPTSKISAEVTASALWRTTVHDALYSMANSVLRAANLGTARYVGLRNTLRVEYQWNRFLITGAYFNRVGAGAFLHQTGDKDNLFYNSVYVSARF